MDNKKKQFIVSDIHGHYTLLKEALNNVGFDNCNPEHILICCGDYFDRGNENYEVLKFFERLNHKVLLRGNHEDLLLKLLQSGKVLPHNYINGTMQTLNDFFSKYSINPLDDTIDFSGKSRTVDRICDFIDETINYYETDNYVFVHGWIPDGAKTSEDLKKASDAEWGKARWTKWIDKYEGTGPLADKTLVCGHVPSFYAKHFDIFRGSHNYDIFYGNGMIAIDAGTFDTKQVNVLVIDDCI